MDPSYTGSKEALIRVFAKHEDGERVVDRIDRFFRTRIAKPAEPAPDDTIIALTEQIRDQLLVYASKQVHAVISDLPIILNPHTDPTAEASDETEQLAGRLLSDQFQSSGDDIESWTFRPAGSAGFFRWPSGGGVHERYFESLVTTGMRVNPQCFIDLWELGGSLWLADNNLIASNSLARRLRGPGAPRITWNDAPLPDNLNDTLQLA